MWASSAGVETLAVINCFISRASTIVKERLALTRTDRAYMLPEENGAVCVWEQFPPYMSPKTSTCWGLGKGTSEVSEYSEDGEEDAAVTSLCDVICFHQNISHNNDRGAMATGNACFPVEIHSWITGFWTNCRFPQHPCHSAAVWLLECCSDGVTLSSLP